MEGIGNRLVAWYLQNHRDLPWRDTQDPYLIWISEVILQQTQVATGLNYYKNITGKYPNVVSLANANQEEVLKCWQGLGYYSRARNMHQAAKQIVEEHNGQFPQTYSQIKNLKGIGDYTAAAIASLAFGLPHAAVDGNVYRVLSRLFAIDTPIDTTQGKKEFQEMADKLLDKDNPGTHNQAMMELGAMVCRPTHPKCGECPVSAFCEARPKGIQQSLPVKSRKTQTRTRHLNYFLIEDNGHVYLCHRQGNDIWKNLFELPLVETEYQLDDNGLLTAAKELLKCPPTLQVKSIQRVRHLLSHQTLHISFTHITSNGATAPLGEWLKVPSERIPEYALPKPIAHYLNLKAEGAPLGL